VNLSKKEIIFIAKFFILFFVLEMIIHLLPLVSFQNFIAQTQGLFFGVEFNKNLIFISDGVFEIVPSCTGLVSASVLFAIIFSLKKPKIKEKFLIFLAGFVLLVLLNFLRIFFVVWTGIEFGIAIAEIVHILSWFSTAIFVIGLWYYFTIKITKEKSFSGFI